MHLTTSSFKRAAKRLATKHALALNFAQESLAEAFGFTNLDAALKALYATGDTPAPPSVSTCLGLTGPQVIALMAAIGLPRAQDDVWQQRSYALLRIVVRDVFKVHGGRPVHAAEIISALRLGAIETRCWDFEGRRQPKPASDVESYLVTLPGYRKENYHHQSSEVEEYHAYLAAPLAFAASRLEALEVPGALTDDELGKLGALALGASQSKPLAVDALRSIVERCEFS